MIQKKKREVRGREMFRDYGQTEITLIYVMATLQILLCDQGLWVYQGLRPLFMSLMRPERFALSV